MARYVWSGDAWVEAAPRVRAVAPMIQSDLPAYKSPLGTGWVEGRTARREEMKRHNVREVDPSEFRRSPPVEPAWVAEWRADRGIARDKP